MVQIMAHHQLGIKPLSESMLVYGQLDPNEQTAVKIEIQTFSFKKMHLKISLENDDHLSWPQYANILLNLEVDE